MSTATPFVLGDAAGKDRGVVVSMPPTAQWSAATVNPTVQLVAIYANRSAKPYHPRNPPQADPALDATERPPQEERRFLLGQKARFDARTITRRQAIGLAVRRMTGLAIVSAQVRLVHCRHALSKASWNRGASDLPE